MSKIRFWAPHPPWCYCSSELEKYSAERGNKAGLAKFYTECIIENKSSLNDQQVIILSGGQQEKVMNFTNAAVQETLEPASNQE